MIKYHSTEVIISYIVKKMGKKRINNMAGPYFDKWKNATEDQIKEKLRQFNPNIANSAEQLVEFYVVSVCLDTISFEIYCRDQLALDIQFGLFVKLRNSIND